MGHPPQAPPEDELVHLRSIPWCAKLLSNPELVIERPTARIPKSDSCDALFSRTFQTGETIRSYVCLYRRPRPSAAGSQSQVTEVKALVTLGPHLDGWAGVCHGGVVAALLDETMSILPHVNSTLAATGRGGAAAPVMMTAYLNTHFVAPVRTPGTVLLTARMVRAEGRKRFIEAVLEDGEGKTLAKGEALFLITRESL